MAETFLLNEISSRDDVPMTTLHTQEQQIQQSKNRRIRVHCSHIEDDNDTIRQQQVKSKSTQNNGISRPSRYILPHYCHILSLLGLFMIPTMIFTLHTSRDIPFFSLQKSLDSILSIFSRHYNYPERLHNRRLSSLTSSSSTDHSLPRILYIVTSLAEYNTGTRSTVRGSDRLRETMLPVVAHGVRSMLRAGFAVDLFLVCHYNLTSARRDLIAAALPESVGLQVWNDASPIGYDTDKSPPFTLLQTKIMHLSREHRFVIKDKILHYDVFVNFEDDMLITGQHVNHFVAVTRELRRLHNTAPEVVNAALTRDEALLAYHGAMTKGQLSRMIPGFIRVEVLLDEKQYPAQSHIGPVPVDLFFDNNKQETADPSICCHLPNDTASNTRPARPTSDQLVIWETHILPLGIRKMPESSWLDWVALQRGPNQHKVENISHVIGDYWSNRHRDYFGRVVRPQTSDFKYINNQGGWMATRQQLINWHCSICPGGFLPPYEEPHYRFDGLDMRNVEWYSGAMQLFTLRHACNLQRIVLLQPRNFSNSLIYHTANNKQRQLAEERRKRESIVKANTLLGQLNTIRKDAEKEL